MSEWLDIDAGWKGSRLLLLAMPPLLAFAYWVYSRTLPAPPGGRAWLLRVLRGIVLAACLLLIAEPFLEIARKQAVRPVLAALLDRSRSMGVEAGGESRMSRALDLLRGDRFSALRRAVRVEALAFSADAEPVSLDTVAATRGDATDISRALAAAVEGRTGQDEVAAVLLLSDGAHNSGADPVAVAEELGVPVHAVGIGSESEQPRDAQILSAEAPATAFVGQPFPVRVEIRGWGVDGPVTVRLSENGRELAAVEAAVPPGGQPGSLELSHVPGAAGPRLYEVSLPALPGEFSRANNRRLLPVTVQPDRVRVEVFAGAPGPELIFPLRALQADSTLTVNSAVLRNESEFYGGLSFAAAAGRIGAADVLVLVDPPRQLLEGLSGAVARHLEGGNGLLMVVGSESLKGLVPGSRAARWLPLSVPRGAALRAGPAAVALTAAGRGHPVLLVGSGAAAPGNRSGTRGLAAAAWTRLPPVSGVLPGLQPQPGSEVLLESGGVPVVAWGMHAGARVIAAVGTGFWRLDFAAAGAGETPEPIREFWRNSVKWLAEARRGGRVRAAPERPVYRSGEEVAVNVAVFDELMRPLPGAEVTAAVAGRSPKVLQPQGDGRHRGVWTGLEVGAHTVTAEARWNGGKVGRDSVEFVVDAYSLEASDVRPDHRLLRRVAAASGGEFVKAEDWSAALERLETPPRLISETTRFEPWGRSWVLAVLVAALAAEWVLRKRGGML
ncbi:MAG: hypothetical protein OXH50_19360 [Gemmatimonadetes bacterium]|nr:hypothetical protein [Gemmatimonadota bacterium]